VLWDLREFYFSIEEMGEATGADEARHKQNDDWEND